MTRKAKKISTNWIRETREAFRDFFDETNFPERHGVDAHRTRRGDRNDNLKKEGEEK